MRPTAVGECAFHALVPAVAQTLNHYAARLASQAAPAAVSAGTVAVPAGRR